MNKTNVLRYLNVLMHFMDSHADEINKSEHFRKMNGIHKIDALGDYFMRYYEYKGLVFSYYYYNSRFHHQYDVHRDCVQFSVNNCLMNYKLNEEGVDGLIAAGWDAKEYIRPAEATEAINRIKTTYYKFKHIIDGHCIGEIGDELSRWYSCNIHHNGASVCNFEKDNLSMSAHCDINGWALCPNCRIHFNDGTTKVFYIEENPYSYSIDKDFELLFGEKLDWEKAVSI